MDQKKEESHENAEKKEENGIIREIIGQVDIGSDEEVVKLRKEKVFSFLKKKYTWITYLVLAVVLWIAVKIRTNNLSGLRDVTTGSWTLGPDLDPFLFLRWAKYIAENGNLMELDMMRYVPFGFKTGNEFILHPYLIAWFHKIASFFGSTSIDQSAVMFPVFMFALTVIVFFLLAREIFIDNLGERKANIIALLSSFFLSVLPPLLPRTIAGIPEKESAAFFFLFIAFYFFLSAWKSKEIKGRMIHSLLSGVSTAGMALIWGGFGYIFITLSVVTFVSFLLGQVNKNKFAIYSAWLFSSFAIMLVFSDRYTLTNILSSVITGVSILVFFIISVHFLICNTDIMQKLKKYFQSGKLRNIPSPISSFVIALILAIVIVSVIYSPSFIFDKVDSISNTLIKPATSRLIQTVAENRQPYFGEWSGSFGPMLQGFPVFFWLFFTGSIYLFYNMTKALRTKERIILSGAYIIFLISIIFSRYAQNHTLNGESSVSLFVYFGGTLLFLFAIGFYYFQYFRNNDESKFKSIDFGFMLLFAFFVLGIISARGAVRLIMILVPPTSIIVSYGIVSGFSKAMKLRKSQYKWFVLIPVSIFVIFAVFAGTEFYKVSNSTSKTYIPSVYNQQWQKAMAWIRENTDANSVFGHWWDYGYWIQSIGERATVLDGGNVISYWNHLMGRHALTGTDERASLEFLYAHDTTHFLIDSTDIGKYGAFSSIGSNESYDRRAFIPTFFKDRKQIEEKKDSVVYFYPAGIALDEDLRFMENDKEVFFPAGVAGIGGILVEKDKGGKLVGQPQGIFVYQDQKYNLPLRYVYHNSEFKDFGTGAEIGIFLMAQLEQTSNGLEMEPEGALLYLSKRVVNSQLAKLYLYGQESEFFKVAHVESDFVIESLRSQGVEVGEFIQFQGFRGPIKIWEINYPADIELKDEFLETSYPESLKTA